MTIIQKIDRWDGKVISLKKDCQKNCEFYIKIKEKELCGIGRAFKYLVPTETPKKCDVRNRKRMHNESFQHSLDYLKTVKETNYFIMEVKQLNLWADQPRN